MGRHSAQEHISTIPMWLMDKISNLETVPMAIVRHEHPQNLQVCGSYCPAWEGE